MTEPVLVIIQARYESQRFPGKVVAPLLGQPMLLWELDRVSRMTTPHRLIVASPGTAENEVIRLLCVRHGYDWIGVGGDPNDVLNRYAVVACEYEATTIVRLVGDTPLLDPRVIDGLLAWHATHGTPVTTDRGLITGPQLTAQQTILPSALTGLALEWGDGQDCAVLSRKALDVAYDEATLASDREHVEPFLFRQPARFSTSHYPCPLDLSWLRCSVDTPDDLAMIERLMDRCLWRYGPGFGWRDIAYLAGQYPDVKEYMLARTHNPAYAAQVAQEQGEPVKSWAQLRYRSQP